MNGRINAYDGNLSIGNNILRYNLTFYRKKCNLSQNQLSIRTGLQRSYIAEIESGKRNPTISKIYQMAIGLKLSPWRLLKPITLNEKLYGGENNFTAYDITLNDSDLLTVEKYMSQLIENIKTYRKKKNGHKKTWHSSLGSPIPLYVILSREEKSLRLKAYQKYPWHFTFLYGDL